MWRDSNYYSWRNLFCGKFYSDNDCNVPQAKWSFSPKFRSIQPFKFQAHLSLFVSTYETSPRDSQALEFTLSINTTGNQEIKTAGRSFFNYRSWWLFFDRIRHEGSSTIALFEKNYLTVECWSYNFWAEINRTGLSVDLTYQSSNIFGIDPSTVVFRMA